jgi:chromosome segregation ATPase
MPHADRISLVAAMALTLALAACSEPPNKEMHEARGAISAARAAGADVYAPQEFEAARAALQRSEEAVAARDYRLALSHALDARERAQEAAREGADRKAAARSEAERAVAEATTALSRTRARLDAISTTPRARRELSAARATVQSATRTVQESRAALSKGDYLGGTKMLNGLTERLDALLRTLSAPPRNRPARAR